MKTITKHYIDGAFVESHGREVMDIINPTNRKVIAQVTLAGRKRVFSVKRAERSNTQVGLDSGKSLILKNKDEFLKF